ncbi:hypothetical protein NSTCB13_06476 [Nostoc sp. DSM 114160]|jgi:type I restriction enzyme S subunit
MPIIFRTPDLKPSRLDTWYYKPEFLSAANKVYLSGKCCSFSEIIDSKRGIKGGATPLGAEYPEQGYIRFYRTSAIKDLLIDETETVFLTPEQDAELARSRLAEGDLILTITGVNFGQSAVVLSRHLPGNISQHSVRFRLKHLDGHYLVTYLSSYYGQLIIWQQAYGATRPAIDYEGIRSLLIRVPDTLTQYYIGDKVRLAERLRERSR